MLDRRPGGADWISFPRDIFVWVLGSREWRNRLNVFKRFFRRAEIMSTMPLFSSSFSVMNGPYYQIIYNTPLPRIGSGACHEIVVLPQPFMQRARR